MEKTRKSQAKQARELLARARANVLGTVLNKMDNQSSGYYYGKYYLPNNEGSALANGTAKKNGVGGYVNGTGEPTAALPADTRTTAETNNES